MTHISISRISILILFHKEKVRTMLLLKKILLVQIRTIHMCGTLTTKLFFNSDAIFTIIDTQGRGRCVIGG